MEYTLVWNFFDKIYCISVNERRDRRKSARREFGKVGLLDRVEFINVEKHPENPEQGIYESHILCMKKGLTAGAETILIFEDDILFKNFSGTTLLKSCAALQTLPEWNAFFLGCMVSSIEKTSWEPLVKVRYQCLTHAYALSSDFAKHLVTIPWQGIPYDGLLKQENSSFYALCPMPAFQSNSPTDNHTVKIDKMRRLLGGLQRLQSINEWFHHNKKTIIIIHVAVLLLAFLACVSR